MTTIQSSTIQRSSMLAMGLIFSGGVLTPVVASPGYEAPLRLSASGGVMQLADASGEWAIRPANEAMPISQAPDAATAMESPTGGHSSQIQTDGGIRYVSGGVGESGRSELNALSNEFNLHLMFATQGSGEYLSAVRVNILDASNSAVLTAVSEGPFFYAQLPPGDYSVEVTPTGERGEDQTQRKAVHLDSSGRSKMDFYWKNPE